jgi:AraC-like DNA-binding protein
VPRRVPYDPLPKQAPTASKPVMVHLRLPPVDAVIDWHRHRWGQIACPLRGSIRVSVATMTWIVPRNRAVWIPPGIDHQVVILGKVEFHAMYVAPAASPLPLNRCVVIEVSPLVRALVDVLADNASGPPRQRRMAICLLLEEINTAASLPLGLPLPAERRLRALCAAMMDDPGSARTLVEWAPIVGASERTLTRLFQTELHTSFAAWRRQLRLARAIDLIGRGVPIAEVAVEVGYANAPAFSTMFRDALGFSPSKLAGRD